MTPREECYNSIIIAVMEHGITMDEKDKLRFHMILDRYEIEERTTEIAVLDRDRNMKLIQEFLKAKIVKGLTKRTIEFYGKSLPRTLRMIGKTVDDITPEDIRNYMAVRLLRDKVTKTTVGNELRNLGSFYEWLYKEELIRKNPMHKIDRIKVEKTQKEAFTELEVEKLREVMKTGREKAMFEILLSTGVRVSELVGIRINEIDWREKEILVHGKGEKDRIVYLNARALLALENYMKERTDASIWLFPKSKWVIHANKSGVKKENYAEWYKVKENVEEAEHMDKSSVEAIFRKKRIDAGIETKCNPHKFRRTFATMALRRGMPVEQVSKLLGHESIETTQIYLDLNRKDIKLAHEKFVN